MLWATCYRHDFSRLLARSPVVTIAPLQELLSWYGWCVSGAWKPRDFISIGHVLFVPSIAKCFLGVSTCVWSVLAFLLLLHCLCVPPLYILALPLLKHFLHPSSCAGTRPDQQWSWMTLDRTTPAWQYRVPSGPEGAHGPCKTLLSQRDASLW